jgi:hypothetical protein
VKAACSECLATPGLNTLGELARKVRVALDGDAALSVGGRWCVIAGRQPFSAQVSARIRHWAHLSVAGISFIVWLA